MERRNLKVFRIKHGLTQQEIAERIGTCRSIYSEVERGSRKCSIAFLDKLQAAFDIPDSEMWALTRLHKEKEGQYGTAEKKKNER